MNNTATTIKDTAQTALADANPTNRSAPASDPSSMNGRYPLAPSRSIRFTGATDERRPQLGEQPRVAEQVRVDELRALLRPVDDLPPARWCRRHRVGVP